MEKKRSERKLVVWNKTMIKHEGDNWRINVVPLYVQKKKKNQ